MSPDQILGAFLLVVIAAACYGARAALRDIMFYDEDEENDR